MTTQQGNHGTQADDERDVLMEQFQQLLAEMQSHGERVKQFAADGEVTPDALASELSDTVMSLLLDLATISFNAVSETRDYVNLELAPAVYEMLDRQEDESDDSVLLVEDAKELIELLTEYRAAFLLTLEALPEEAKGKVRETLARTDRALERVREITLDEGEEDESDDEDQGGEEATESPPEASAEA